MSDLSWLNPTPHAIAVYASQPTSPLTTQHSLPSGRYSLLGPDFHRLDRTSFAWRTHSITSSAHASSIGGTSRPSALAILRLMTNSNLVACWTGKSDGFAPLRILSTNVAERYHMSLMLTAYENRQPASLISRTPQISGRRWRAAACAMPARKAMKVASSSTKMVLAAHARISAKLDSKSSDPRASKIR